MVSKNKHSEAVFLDIDNAFNEAWHDELLYKLKHLNTPTVIFNIIISFLYSIFIVQIGDTNSDIKHSNAGVPQRSKLYPILFNLYISDFPTTIDKEISLYVNVSAIYSSSDKVDKVIDNIQTHLEKVPKWSQSWNIVLKILKSSAILFTLCRLKNYNTVKFNEQNIACYHNIKFLGVILDKKHT